MRVAGIFSSRALLALSAIVFGASVIALPEGSFVGTFVHLDFGTHCYTGSHGAYVKVNNTEIQFSDLNSQSELASDYIVHDFSPRPRPSGFWALTSETTIHLISVLPLNSSASANPQTESAVRSAYVDRLVSDGRCTPTDAIALRAADTSTTRTLASGHVHNIISLISGVLLLMCLKVQHPWGWLRRKEIPGLCPKCNYDLTATPDSARCPECGHFR